MTTPTSTQPVRVRSRLAALMEAREIKTLTAMAELSGVSYPTLMALFHDKAKGVMFPVVVRLCQALQCLPGDLFTLEGHDWEGGHLAADHARVRDLVGELAQEVGIPGRIAKRK